MNKEYRFEEFFYGRPLTLWEMRNMVIQQSYAKIICNFNFNTAANVAVNEVSPLQQEYLFINTIIREQAAKLKINIKTMQEILALETSEEHQKNLRIAKAVEESFLFDGFEDYFESLIPQSTYSSLDLHNYTKASAKNPFPTVLCHNDIHQNNILMKLVDNRDLLIIDNEYAGWNPMAMDLAVFINETMINNTHPADNGVKEYADNLMSEYEQEQMIK
jgi:thiamine kinase-like enzyme